MSRPFSLKPFSCSLCMTFWTGIVYLLAEGALTLPSLAYVCLVSMLTPNIHQLLALVSDLLTALLAAMSPGNKTATRPETFQSCKYWKEMKKARQGHSVEKAL